MTVVDIHVTSIACHKLFGINLKERKKGKKDKQILRACLCNQEGQGAVQKT